MTDFLLEVRQAADVNNMVADTRHKLYASVGEHMYLLDEVAPHIVCHQRLSHR